MGIGKGLFTDVIYEIMAGYAEKNITDFSNITGHFNSTI
jgi:hypothetical protein